MSDTEALELLSACKPLAEHLAIKTGYQLTEKDLKILVGYYRVYDATTESQLKWLSSKVGLWPTGVAWLTVALELHNWDNSQMGLGQTMPSI